MFKYYLHVYLLGAVVYDEVCVCVRRAIVNGIRYYGYTKTTRRRPLRGSIHACNTVPLRSPKLKLFSKDV